MAVVLRKPDGGEVPCWARVTRARRAQRRRRSSSIVCDRPPSSSSCASRAGRCSMRNRGSSQMEPASTAPGLRAPPKTTRCRTWPRRCTECLTDWTSLIAIQYSALDALDASKAGGEFRAAAKAADAVGATRARRSGRQHGRKLGCCDCHRWERCFRFSSLTTRRGSSVRRLIATRRRGRWSGRGALAEALELPPGAAARRGSRR